MGHVDEEAARHRHLSGDAGSLGADRLFRDLDDDRLAAFERVSDGGELATGAAASTAPVLRFVVFFVVIAGSTVLTPVRFIVIVCRSEVRWVARDARLRPAC